MLEIVNYWIKANVETGLQIESEKDGNIRVSLHYGGPFWTNGCHCFSLPELEFSLQPGRMWVKNVTSTLKDPSIPRYFLHCITSCGHGVQKELITHGFNGSMKKVLRQARKIGKEALWPCLAPGGMAFPSAFQAKPLISAQRYPLQL
jgi:hypothetical protein